MLKKKHPLPCDDCVLFNEDAHQYVLPDYPDVRLTTITEAVALLLPRFDTTAVSTKLAKKGKGRYAGMTAASIRAEWTMAARLGTQMHKAIEDYYNGADKTTLHHLPHDFVEVDDFLCKDLNLIPYRSELKMADRTSLLAGTADQIYQSTINPLHFVIADWKRTATIPKTNPYERGLKELAHHDASKFIKFAMQLNLYALLLTQTCGLSVTRLLLVAMYPLGGYEIHDVPFMPEARAVYDRYVATAESVCN